MQLNTVNVGYHKTDEFLCEISQRLEILPRYIRDKIYSLLQQLFMAIFELTVWLWSIDFHNRVSSMRREMALHSSYSKVIILQFECVCPLSSLFVRSWDFVFFNDACVVHC
jgi:hypothetical protein